MMADRTVMGLALPDDWDGLVSKPRWTAHREDARVAPTVVESIFGEAPDRSWRFYTFDEVVTETEDWHQEEDPAWFGIEPDGIDPEPSVLIGELGYDRPFALDFRTPTPCVRFMRVDGRWPVVADSLSDLIVRLDEER